MKKTLKHPKANEQARALFQAKIQDYENKGHQIVYLDESGFAVDSPRTHGYSTVGKRCYGTHNWQSRGRINAIGAIIGFSFLTVSLFNHTIDSDVFYSWLTQDLLPKVSENMVIVMDNASFHKRQDMLNAINEKHCILEFLPPYSPDLNPIERKWAQAKAVRKEYRCPVESLFTNHF